MLFIKNVEKKLFYILLLLIETWVITGMTTSHSAALHLHLHF